MEREEGTTVISGTKSLQLNIPLSEEEHCILAQKLGDSASTKELGEIYYTGDIYEPSDAFKPWAIDSNDRPYLRHIKKISRGWPHLKYLADWMEVTTTPKKWKLLTQSSREQRASLTRIAMIDFPHGKTGTPGRTDINSIFHLRDLFNDPNFNHSPDHLRLFVLEDLSRDIIEEFGSRYDTDPSFWRYHISDFRWYNSTDPWVELDELPHISRERNFWTIRYVHPRHFRTKESFWSAIMEAGTFNVLRHLDEDPGHRSPYFSISHGGPIDSVVCLCRRKTSLWLQPCKGEQKGTVAILVVDPSVKEGFPLWSGYRSFCPAPSMKADIAGLPPRDSAFEEMIYWVMEIIAESPTNIHTHPKYLVLPILTIIAAEWLTLLQYCTTRMNQVELDLQNPIFTNPPLGLESSLRRIYHWRRALPIYLKWVNETLRNILSDKMLTPNDPVHPPFLKLRDDFLIIKQDLEAIQTQVQNQIMNMVSTVGAITSLQESQRAVEQNRNITRLTYLAAVFVPMSFVSSFLSMTPNVRELAETFKLYFILSLPLTFIALSVVQWAYLKRRVLAGINRSESSK